MFLKKGLCVYLCHVWCFCLCLSCTSGTILIINNFSCTLKPDSIILHRALQCKPFGQVVYTLILVCWFTSSSTNTINDSLADGSNSLWWCNNLWSRITISSREWELAGQWQRTITSWDIGRRMTASVVRQRQSETDDVECDTHVSNIDVVFHQLRQTVLQLTCVMFHRQTSQMPSHQLAVLLIACFMSYKRRNWQNFENHYAVSSLQSSKYCLLVSTVL